MLLSDFAQVQFWYKPFQYQTLQKKDRNLLQRD